MKFFYLKIQYLKWKLYWMSLIQKWSIKTYNELKDMAIETIKLRHSKKRLKKWIQPQFPGRLYQAYILEFQEKSGKKWEQKFFENIMTKSFSSFDEKCQFIDSKNSTKSSKINVKKIIARHNIIKLVKISDK